MKPPAPAQNVAGVLAQLDAIVADARAESSRLGYFAALYRLVTREVAAGIASGVFDDGARMERLDTNFANRCFAALSAHLGGRPTPKAWGVAFAAAKDPTAIAVQHLLLGMTAHLNVDLGAAVAQIAPGSGVRNDFEADGQGAELPTQEPAEVAGRTDGAIHSGDRDRPDQRTRTRRSFMSMPQTVQRAGRVPEVPSHR